MARRAQQGTGAPARRALLPERPAGRDRGVVRPRGGRRRVGAGRGTGLPAPIDGPQDHQALLASTPLDATGRSAVTDAVGRLAPQLTQRLAAARDPARPVALTVVAFGGRSDPEALEAALKPVGGGVDAVDRPDGVGAAFIHAAAGGIHG